jgi:hypothetical protein
MLGVDFCNQLSKTVHSRGDRISITTTFIVMDHAGRSVNGDDVRDDHEDRLTANPDSSEVRLTPLLQLRLNPVDRIMGIAHNGRGPQRPHLGRRFRRSARLTRPLLPLRVACWWTNPSRSDLAFMPRLACTAHTSMGRCDNQSEATSIVEFHEHDPEESSRDVRICGLSHPKKPTIAHSLHGDTRGCSVSS